MKVLFLSNSIGGLKSFRTEVIDAMLERGDSVAICSPLEVSPDFFSNRGCGIYPVDMGRHSVNPFKELGMVREYERVIREAGPDVVLAYTIKPNLWGSIACNRMGVPVIASVTGLGVALEGGGLLRKISVWLLRHGIKYADHVYFQNQESLDFFKSNGIKMKSYSLVAGSGVNLQKFAYTAYPADGAGIHFLYTGRILEPKGIGLYLEAAKVIKEEYPDAVFHIVGIKDDVDYSAKVEDYAAQGIVRFHGAQSDVRPFISMAHCQVHPTYYPEGMSNVLLESAAMGRPAITTDRSGCREIVDDGATGFIIRQKDLDGLIEAIRSFIRMPWTEKERMGRNAHDKVARCFDRAKVVDEYLRKADSLASNKRNA